MKNFTKALLAVVIGGLLGGICWGVTQNPNGNRDYSIEPLTDNSINLGAYSYRWKWVHINHARIANAELTSSTLGFVSENVVNFGASGILTVGSTASVAGAGDIAGVLRARSGILATGTSRFAGTTTLGTVVTTGSATLASLAVTANATVGNTAAVGGTFSTVGNVDNAGAVRNRGLTFLSGTNRFAGATTVGTFTTTGSATLASAGVTGLLTYGALKTNIVAYATTTTARTITAAESGTTFVMTPISGTKAVVTFTLPAAAAGLYYTFIDQDPEANADLWITATAGDTINGGTAGKSYTCTGDAVKQSVTLVSIDGTSWEVISEVGTWANNNS